LHKIIHTQPALISINRQYIEREVGAVMTRVNVEGRMTAQHQQQ